MFHSILRSKVPPAGSSDNTGITGAMDTDASGTENSLVHFFSDDDDQLGKRKKNMLVFFIGGISYLEIAALRFLSNDPLYPYNIIIGTTSIGNSLLQSLVHGNA